MSRALSTAAPIAAPRAKLPVIVIEQLTLEVAFTCEDQIPDHWLWKGRHVKVADGTSVTMGMDELRCKLPEMVKREVWTCLLAYSMIRQKLLQAALEKGISPREMSFTNAMQLVAAAWMVMPLLDGKMHEVLVSAQLQSMSDQIVGKRPGRVEPRAVKRRPKPFRLLTMLREKARKLLLSGIDPYKKQK